jgi:hypothetical protein
MPQHKKRRSTYHSYKIQPKESNYMSTTDLSFMAIEPEKVRNIFGPGSSSQAAHELSRRSPETYLAYKKNAVYALRIVPEDSLSRQHRVKKEILEQHAVAALAAEKNDKIAVPDSLADRLSLPRGTRCDYATLRTLMGKASNE